MKRLSYSLLLLIPTFLFVGCSGPTFTEPTRPSVEDSSIQTEAYERPIQVGQQTVLVEMVDTNQARSQGLSGRDQLLDGQGMLFDFSNTTLRQPSFWMKDMKFAIDIIWIADGKIVGITSNVPPPAGPNKNIPTYSPPADITHVLEVPAGYSERANIKLGDTVQI